MSDHDEFCPGSTNECICVSLGRARADERKREALRGPSTAWYDTHERAVLADLRAKVEALPCETDNRTQNDVVERADVLALIDGSSDG